MSGKCTEIDPTCSTKIKLEHRPNPQSEFKIPHFHLYKFGHRLLSFKFGCRRSSECLSLTFGEYNRTTNFLRKTFSRIMEDPATRFGYLESNVQNFKKKTMQLMRIPSLVLLSLFSLSMLLIHNHNSQNDFRSG